MTPKQAGTPIKDRGIQWLETYGDKSAYLKTEFENQVGPGSYFRWEGHDSTTGTDYYVVVSPGYSKKHGYHFFAGLRKMPASQGASGKKFNTQREAMSYANDKWRTPPPSIKPAKPYTAQDLVGKDIVTESTHNAAAEGFLVKKAMSLQGSGGIETEWTRRVGPRVLTDMYCFAFKASKVMGFLSGLYSRLRVIGVDGMNTPTSQQGTDSFTGKKGPLPVSPALAQCLSPDPDTFKEQVYGEGNSVENKLFDMKRDEDPDTKRNAVQGIEYKQPFGDESDGHSVRRWRHMKLTPKVSFSSHPDKAWLDGLSARGISAQPAKDTGTSVKSRKDYKFEVPSDQWEAFKGEVLQAHKGHIYDLTGDQKNFVDLLEHRRKNGQSIEQDLDKPYYETIPLKGSQLMVYDDMGKPISLNVNYKSPQTQATQQVDYVLRDPDGLVDQHSDPELGKLVQQRDAALQAVGDKSPGWEQQQQAAAQAQQAILAHVSGGGRSQPGAYKQALAAKDEASAKLCLDGFREMAAHGHVPLTHEDVAHAETCAPMLGNVDTVVPYVDTTLLPVNHDNSLRSPQDLRQSGLQKAKVPYCPPYSVKARKQQMGGATKYAARWFEPGKGWVYGPLPEGVKPVQKFNGTRVVADSTSMYRGKPDGSVHKIDNGQWTRHDPNSKGSFIPGRLIDVNLSPEYASSKGTDKHLSRLGQDRNGWVIHFQEHPIKQSGGQLTTSRQQSSKPFFPGANLDEHEVDLGDGRQSKLSDHAFAQAGKVFFRDNMAAYQFMKGKLGLKDDEVGPVTHMTDQDLKIIDDIAADAIAYYEQVEKTPQEQRGQVDQDKYKHGKICANCGGQTPPPEVLDAMASAIENPEEAFKPKEGVLWGIKHAQGWVSDDKGEVVLFGAESQAQKALALPEVKRFAEQGSELLVSDYPGNGQKTLMVPSLAKRMQQDPSAELTPGGNDFAQALRTYNEQAPESPDEPADQLDMDDMEPSDFAEEGETLDPLAPEAHDQAQVPAQDQTQQVVPPLMEPQPIIPEQPIIQPGAPVEPEQPLIQQEGPIPAAKPKQSQQVLGGARTRLVRLANWLDDNGRRAEADRVDGILREIVAQVPQPQQPQPPQQQQQRAPEAPKAAPRMVGPPPPRPRNME